MLSSRAESGEKVGEKAMIIKIKCDDNANIFDVLDQVILHRNNKDGTYLFRHYKIHKTTTAKQVEYVVERLTQQQRQS